VQLLIPANTTHRILHRIGYVLLAAVALYVYWRVQISFGEQYVIIPGFVAILIWGFAIKIRLRSGAWEAYLAIALPLGELISFSLGYGMAGEYTDVALNIEYTHKIRRLHQHWKQKPGE
jgi:hypothetical protein